MAQLLSEVHHIQWMSRFATKFLSSSWGSAPSKHTVERATLPSPQKIGGSGMPIGLEACPPASQIQLICRLQKDTAGEQPSFKGDATYPQSVTTASLRSTRAWVPGSMQSHHRSQKRPGQGPPTALHSSRQGATQHGEMETISAQQSLKAPVVSLSDMGNRARHMSEKSAGCPHARSDAHTSLRGHKAGAYRQDCTIRASAPFSSAAQLSASDLIQLPGHSEEEVNRPSSVGVTSQHQPPVRMRYHCHMP